jgi:hypothetical protein
MSACNVTKNAFGRWILTDPQTPTLAWSGSRWVETDRRGFGIEGQVSNFATREAAEDYAWQVGFSD